ncbi:MAG: helix-turn-helix domain-containing protein [Rikenellaceae bacterium]|nr:helix-turn-helix domain-containing protein [Rikenellaceae bacterium]
MKAKPDKTGDIKQLIEETEKVMLLLKRINKESFDKKPIGSERYLNGEEVMKNLSICPRTLQNLRDTRQIPYTIFGHKILYPESEIDAILKSNYYAPYEISGTIK